MSPTLCNPNGKGFRVVSPVIAPPYTASGSVWRDKCYILPSKTALVIVFDTNTILRDSSTKNNAHKQRLENRTMGLKHPYLQAALLGSPRILGPVRCIAVDEDSEARGWGLGLEFQGLKAYC